jgi:hypothetical protein
MPRVLHLLSRFDVGGTERQLVERLRRHPRGFEPFLACSELYGKFLAPVRALGIEPIVVPVRGLAHPSAALAVARLAMTMRERKIDLVHANDFAMSVLGLAAARLSGARIIVNRVDLGHLRPGFGVAHRRLEAFTARRKAAIPKGWWWCATVSICRISTSWRPSPATLCRWSAARYWSRSSATSGP